MSRRVIYLVEAKDTARLLKLTQPLSDEDSEELLDYIGSLETSQKNLAEALYQVHEVRQANGKELYE